MNVLGGWEIDSVEEKGLCPINNGRIADGGVFNRVVAAGCIPRPDGFAGAGGMN